MCSIAKRVVGVALALSIVAGFGLEAARAAEKPEVVRLGFFGGPRPWIIGKAQGLFEKDLGTKVQWVQFSSGAGALNSLAAGEVDISRLGSTPTVASIARGLPIEMIALSGVIATSERLIAKQDIKQVSDLRGKSVAYPPGSTAHYALMAALKVAKVPAGEVKLLALAPNEMLAAWTRGDISAAYVWGPFSHQMENSGGHQVLVTRDLQQNGYYVWNDYVVRKAFAEKHPETVAQFLRTFQKTIDMYNADKEGMVKVVAQHLSQNEAAVADTMAGLYFPPLKEQLSSRFLGEGGPILKAMKDQAEFLVELGDLRQREVPESFARGVNTSYLKRAVGE
jgi:taurine transport system substrate-binding protein